MPHSLPYPLDLSGPEFLAVFGLSTLAAAAAAALTSWLARLPAGAPDRRALADLDPFEIAYLRGGASAAINAAVASLVRRERVTIEGQRLSPTKESASASEHPFEDAVEQQMRRGKRALSDLRRAAAKATRTLTTRLRDRGLIVSTSAAIAWNLIARGAAIAVLALGAAKLVVGVTRARPVGILALLLIVVAIVSAVALRRLPHRTYRGNRALDALQVDHAALKTTIESAPDQVSSLDTALALGLFGAAAIALGLPALASALEERELNSATSFISSNSCGGSSCGASCGSSCGGGCGGCGGCGGG